VKRFESIEAFEQAAGTHLGFSDYVVVTQAKIDAFADATNDHQWIHVDPEKASQGPFSTTIAHGFLSLALIPSLLFGIYSVEGLTMGVNYGCNKVRFPAPVPVGSRLRAGAALVSCTRRSNGVLATVEVTVEIESSDRPACVAETMVLLIS
jgi:acyl dehydratase